MIWVLYIYDRDGKLHDVLSPSRNDRECQLHVLTYCTRQFAASGFTWHVRAESDVYNTADVALALRDQR